MPPKGRASRIMGVFSVVFFFLGLIFTAVLRVIVFRVALYAVLIKQDAGSICARSKNIVSLPAGIINFITIHLLKFVYRYIALWLTKWENPRSNADYTTSLVLKMFWFQFVNTYSSIFYVAFFKNATFAGTPGRYHRFTTAQFRFEGCSEQGCLKSSSSENLSETINKIVMDLFLLISSSWKYNCLIHGKMFLLSVHSRKYTQ